MFNLLERIAQPPVSRGVQIVEEAVHSPNEPQESRDEPTDVDQESLQLQSTIDDLCRQRDALISQLAEAKIRKYSSESSYIFVSPLSTFCCRTLFGCVAPDFWVLFWF